MLTRITTYHDTAYQITAIVFEDGRYEIVEVIAIPLIGRPTVALWDELPYELQQKLERLIHQ